MCVFMGGGCEWCVSEIGQFLPHTHQVKPGVLKAPTEASCDPVLMHNLNFQIITDISRYVRTYLSILTPTLRYLSVHRL